MIDLSEHVLTIKHDDGLYRHLVCTKPGTIQYSFAVTTWPGHLAITGDCGDYMFRRLPDMFGFFRSESGRISPDYWSEKLVAPRQRAATYYEPARFHACVTEWFMEAAEGLTADDVDDLWGAVSAILASGAWGESERDARSLAIDFAHKHHRMRDAWEWNLREFDPQFLNCCHAIVWAVDQYDKQEVPS